MQLVAKMVLKNWETHAVSTPVNDEIVIDEVSLKTTQGDEYSYVDEWNPLLLAIFYNHMHIVRYFCEVVKVHLRYTLSMSKGGEHSLLFTLAVGLIKKECLDIFKYLWETYDFIWDCKCLKQALLMIIFHNRADLLVFMLRSKTTHSLFLSFSYHFRITFLSQFVESYLSNNDEDVTTANPD